MSSRRGGAGAARMCRGAPQRERWRRGAAIRLQSAPAGLCLFAALQSLSALSLPRASRRAGRRRHDGERRHHPRTLACFSSGRKTLAHPAVVEFAFVL